MNDFKRSFNMGGGKNKFFPLPHLTVILLILQAAGYLIMNISPSLLTYLLLDPYAILHGQIWRLVTWLTVPTASLLNFALMAFLFYVPIGMQLESVWGDRLYNIYIFIGMGLTVIGAFLLCGYYFIALSVSGAGAEQTSVYMQMISMGLSARFSPYYLMMSIFFGYAATFPDNMVMFMFLIPIKMKWLGIAYGALTVYDIYQSDVPGRVVIVCSLLNFVIFFLWSQKKRGNIVGVKELKRRQEFKQAVKMSPSPDGAHHRCAICGATEETNPDFEFRYCSKCNGIYEYCQEHLFTHEHVK